MADYTLLFLSSAEISLPLLNTLHNDARCEILGLVCQPDKEAGRKGQIKAPTTKAWALEQGIAVYQPEKLSRANELLEDFSLNPPDFLLTFAYGQILNQKWLDLPRFAPLNVHASLLPKYRGASPIQSALLNGDGETGLSLMKMVRAMDEGPVYSQSKIFIQPDWNAEDLHDALAENAAQFVPDELSRLVELRGKGAKEQNHEEASYCSLISREEGFVDFNSSAEDILNRYRAYSPWPGLWTTYKSKRLKLLELEYASKALPPGALEIEDGEIYVGVCGASLRIKKLQLEGKRAMNAEDFLRGQPEFNGPLAS